MMVEALLLGIARSSALPMAEGRYTRRSESRSEPVVPASLNRRDREGPRRELYRSFARRTDTTEKHGKTRELCDRRSAQRKKSWQAIPTIEPEKHVHGKETVSIDLKERVFRDDILVNRRRPPDGRRFSEIRPDRARSSAGFPRSPRLVRCSPAARRRRSVTVTLGTAQTSSLWTISRRASSSGSSC